MPVYPWYELIEDTSIEQGDIFERFIVYTPRDDDPSMIEEQSIDIILMTQSCDIINDKITHLLFCPIYSLEEYSRQHPELKNKGKRNEIRAGRVLHMHLLDQFEKESFKRDFRLVNFTRVKETSKIKLIEFARSCGPRQRLLPPYREHLAQAFARFFMRVGLPSPMPKF